MDGDRMGRDPNAELYRVLIETADHPDTPLVVVAELALALATVVEKRLNAIMIDPAAVKASQMADHEGTQLYALKAENYAACVVSGLHTLINGGTIPDDRWLAPAEDQYRNYTAD